MRLCWWSHNSMNTPKPTELDRGNILYQMYLNRAVKHLKIFKSPLKKFFFSLSSQRYGVSFSGHQDNLIFCFLVQNQKQRGGSVQMAVNQTPWKQQEEAVEDEMKVESVPHQTPTLRVKPSVWLRAPLSCPQSRRATPDRLPQSTPPAFWALYLVGHYRRQIHSLHVVQSLSRVQLFVTPYGLQHARLPCPSSSPRVCSNSCPLSQWYHPTICPLSSPVIPFSSCPQYFPASGSFLIIWLFASGGQSIGASALAIVPPMNVQDRSPLGWIGWISSHSKGFSRVFSNTTVLKRQFFGTQSSLWSNSHIRTWLLEIP